LSTAGQLRPHSSLLVLVCAFAQPSDDPQACSAVPPLVILVFVSESCLLPLSLQPTPFRLANIDHFSSRQCRPPLLRHSRDNANLLCFEIAAALLADLNINADIFASPVFDSDFVLHVLSPYSHETQHGLSSPSRSRSSDSLGHSDPAPLVPLGARPPHKACVTGILGRISVFMLRQTRMMNSSVGTSRNASKGHASVDEWHVCSVVKCLSYFHFNIWSSP
jgi:hypothetical protein